MYLLWCLARIIAIVSSYLFGYLPDVLVITGTYIQK